MAPSGPSTPMNLNCRLKERLRPCGAGDRATHGRPRRPAFQLCAIDNRNGPAPPLRRSDNTHRPQDGSAGKFDFPALFVSTNASHGEKRGYFVLQKILGARSSKRPTGLSRGVKSGNSLSQTSACAFTHERKRAAEAAPIRCVKVVSISAVTCSDNSVRPHLPARSR